MRTLLSVAIQLQSEGLLGVGGIDAFYILQNIIINVPPC